MVKETELIRIRELLEHHPRGLTIEDVSQKLSMNRGTAGKYLNLLVASGQADLRSLGPAKLFSLSQRVPVSQMLSFSSNMILILDSDLLIREVNDSFLQYFGLERQNIVGVQVYHSVLAGYLTALHADLFKATLEGGGSAFDAEMRIEEKGHILKMKVLPLLFDRGGRGIGIILEDITGINQATRDEHPGTGEHGRENLKASVAMEEKILEHRKIEKALLESEEKYRALVENLPDAIFTLNDRGIITYISPTIRSITCSEPSALLGRTFQDMVFPEDLITYTQGMEASYRGNDKPFEIRVLTMGGGQKWVRVSGRSIVRKSLYSGYQGVITDLEERKNTEDALRRANRQIVLLNKITRHDILNGILKIMACLDIIEQQTTDRKVLKIIEKERGYMKAIEQQILFTRDYQNIGIRAPQWVNAGQSISVAGLKLNLGKISLINTISNLEIFADELIEKVFYNLIENSIQHGERATTITFSATRRGRDLLLVCEDDGVGIPGQEKELIFEHSREGRMNYGLFFSREVLAITGLSIRETGTAEQGARFEVFVPEGMFREVHEV